MSDFERMGLDSAALDRYITGNYGEDQFADQTDDHVCDRCGGCGEEGHPEARYDEADALDVCYHCQGTGRCSCPPASSENQQAARSSYDGGGFVVTQFTAKCANGGCTNQVWHSIASHGGDMEDVDSPMAGWCAACRKEAVDRWLAETPTVGADTVAPDLDDLPFD